jgi:hypothetical protein
MNTAAAVPATMVESFFTLEIAYLDSDFGGK